MVPIAVMNLLGIQMTLGTIAALLMIIGYSVDSDILLNNSVLRRTGDFYESVNRAMRTGVTMTLTSMAAMIVMAVVAALFGVDLLRNIGIILSVGLCADLMNTYLLNVSLLRWYKFGGETVMLEPIKNNWQILLLVVVVLGATVALFAPQFGPQTAPGENVSEAQQGITNLQYGLDLAGGTRVRAPPRRRLHRHRGRLRR